ncbi:MAG: stage II sporulation protein M, partial [Bacteroidia bacterium]
KNANPDRLSELFVQVTDDLSYARTYYGNRVVRVFLNQLTQRLFRKLFRNSVNHFRRFREFVANDLPLNMYRCRKQMLLALIIFLISAAIGVFSAIQDPGFSESILGHGYIKMTQENIEKGDPMAVYKDDNLFLSFLAIAQNNLLVAFRAFIFGLLFSLGSISILVFNGIMVGVFQYYFLARGVVLDSLLTIWMHGAMEIPAIIISGGAGLVMGGGLVFPGTYTRLQALRISARAGIKIMAGITPVIIVAAFIEAFLTRQTDYPYIVRAAFILLQLVFLTFYFIYLPYKKSKQKVVFNLQDEKIPVAPPIENELKDLSPGGDVFSVTFRLYVYSLSGTIRRLAIPLVLLSLFLIILAGLADQSGYYYQFFFFQKLPEYLSIENYPFLLPVLAAALSTVVYVAGFLWRKDEAFKPEWKEFNTENKLLNIKRFVLTFLISLLWLSALLIPGAQGAWIFILISPPFVFLISVLQILDFPDLSGVSKTLNVFLGTPVFIIYTYFSLLFPATMLLLLSDMATNLLGIDMIEWVITYTPEIYKWVQISTKIILLLFGLLLAVLLLATGIVMVYYSAMERIHAPALIARLRSLDLMKTDD